MLNKKTAAGCKYNIDSFNLYIKSNQVELLVYDFSGCVVGFILTFDMVDWGFIEVVAVKPEFRRAGIGKKLINHVIAHKKPQWFVTETCYNKIDRGVKKFITECGFVPSHQRTEWVYIP